MMRRRICIAVSASAVMALTGAGLLVWTAQPGPMTQSTHVPRMPAIQPDYSNLVIPPNIAPLNFVVMEPGTAFRVSIRADRGESIELAGRRPGIEIPLHKWRALLDANAGGKFEILVFVSDAHGRWTRFDPLVNTIAREPIDELLVYRLIDPVYRCWGNISIQQRELSSFDDTCILSNRSMQYDCVNCHSFSRDNPDRMALQIRSQSIGPRMLLARDGEAAAVNTTTDFNPSPSSYLSWHPNGRAIAFASIKVTQFFHAVGETRDVFDRESDLGVYLVDSNTVTTTPAIARSDRLETYPSWSPDGGYLYFCSAPQLPIERFREVRYDLMRIAYDPPSGAWGDPEILLAAEQAGASVTHPRVSPDGRFLMFCMCDYGNFSIYRPESDLYLMDLSTRQYHRMEVNSDLADSYHTWSGNSRWFVFSSKRRDGLLTHLYISYVDEAGRAHKAFILPQKDPAFYDTSLKVFNVPELTTGRADTHSRRLLQAIQDTTHAVNAGLDHQVTTRPTATEPDSPWRSAR